MNDEAKAQLERDKREPWYRQYGEQVYHYELSHAWCLPAKYVADGWVKGMPPCGLPDECDRCRLPVEVQKEAE